MNDVREAIERIGAGFDPEAGLEDLARRGRRAAVRRRAAAGTVALLVAAAGSLIAVRAFSNVSHEQPAKVRVAIAWSTASPASPATRATPTESMGSPVAESCPTPSGDSPPPVLLSRTSGSAGSSVEVSGTFQTGEDWLQLWWNADGDTLPDTLEAPPWPATGPELTFGPIGPGPVTNIASMGGPGETGDCAFDTEVTIPDVPAGSYQIVAVFGGADAPPSQTGYVWLSGPFTFEVTG
jgi:hypothetical protein